MAPAVFALTELAVVDIDGIFRTADLRRAALHVEEHGLSAEVGPVRERIAVLTEWSGEQSCEICQRKEQRAREKSKDLL